MTYPLINGIEINAEGGDSGSLRSIHFGAVAMAISLAVPPLRTAQFGPTQLKVGVDALLPVPGLHSTHFGGLILGAALAPSAFVLPANSLRGTHFGAFGVQLAPMVLAPPSLRSAQLTTPSLAVGLPAQPLKTVQSPSVLTQFALPAQPLKNTQFGAPAMQVLMRAASGLHSTHFGTVGVHLANTALPVAALRSTHFSTVGGLTQALCVRPLTTTRFGPMWLSRGDTC